LIWILPLVLGCGGDELSASWQLDRTRILAVRPIVDTEPDQVLGTRAEGGPGETLRFESLTYALPEDPIGGLLWIACLDEENPNDGCSIEEEGDEGDEGDEGEEDDDLDSKAGFIGFEPFFSPVLPIPEGILDTLPDEDREEGISALVNIIAIPESELDELDALEDEVSEKDDLNADNYEIAFKRVPISESPTPNHNPDIIDFVVAGQRLEGAAGFNARTGKTYIVEPLLAEGHIETYAYTLSTGEVEYRSEEPYFSWFTELGADEMKHAAQFDQPYSLHPYNEVEWTAPDNAGMITIHVVVRDRRGGMGWRTLTVNVL